MDVINIKNLCFSYGDIPILRDISLDVKSNQVMCLFGANGSGKTTLLDCISALRNVNKGQLHILGRPISKYTPRELARYIAYVPQKSEVTFPYSVMDVMLMSRASRVALYSKPKKSDVNICINALRDIGILGLKDKLFTELSGGEAQLVLIARALAQETEIIIMDEPTAHLDYSYKYIVLDTIVDLIKNRDVTILMASHMPNHCYYLWNKGIDVSVAVLQEGSLYINDVPKVALTKETIYDLYNVDVKCVDYEYDGFCEGQYIIPLGKRGFSDEKMV